MTQNPILVVEDNAINQRVLGDILLSFGYQPAIAGSGEKALEILKHQTFSLVLMDVRLPGMDGLKTTRMLRDAETQNSRVPVIAMTADAMTGVEARCRCAGMDDYLTKPIVPAELRARLNYWLTKKPAMA